MTYIDLDKALEFINRFQAKEINNHKVVGFADYVTTTDFEGSEIINDPTSVLIRYIYFLARRHNPSVNDTVIATELIREFEVEDTEELVARAGRFVSSDNLSDISVIRPKRSFLGEKVFA